MKTLKFLVVSIFLVVFISTGYSQGNKFTIPVDFTWDENYVPIECVGPYTCILNGNVTVFHTGKILNKAKGTITASNGKEYTIESIFNCNNFVSKISASGNSNQAWTFRVRCADTKKLVATIHMTFHYTDGQVDPNSSSVNIQTNCH